MDRGISVAWYDLDDKNREPYCAWLHSTYIPKLLKSPGILWVAHYKCDPSLKPPPILRHTKEPLPAGNAYIFLLGAEDAHAFSALTPYNQKGKVDPADAKMLAMRVGERRNIFTEEGRVNGPAAGKREGEYTPAPCIQLGSFNSGSPEDEDELLAWYADYRLPVVGAMSSALGMRKLASVSGWAKHGVMYEFTSLEDRANTFRAQVAKTKEQEEWNERVVSKLVHAPGSPNVAERIYPPIRAR